MIVILFFFLSIIIYSVTPAKRQLLSAIGVGLLMFVSAFYLTDTNQYDLVNHREMYDTLQRGGLLAAQQYSEIDRSPLFVWMLYVMSLLEDNRYTSALPTFIGYFILLYLLIQTSRKYKIPKSSQLFFLLFLLCIIPWHDYTAGIRGALAYSLCCLGVYFDFRKNNKLLAAVFYVFPVFIHQAAVIFLILRLFVYLINIFPFTKRIIYGLCLLGGSMVQLLGVAADDLANYTGLRILSIISTSFQSYAVEGHDVYEPSVVIIRVCAVLLIYFLTKRHLDNETESESDIFAMYTMLMLIAIGFVWQYDIVCRYTVACMMLSPLVLYRTRPDCIPLLVLFAILNLLRYYFSYYSHWEIII